MTLVSSSNKKEHTVDGIQVTFAYDFRIDDEDDLVAYADGVLYTESRTVTGVGEAVGGTIIFDVAPVATITVLSLLREVSLDQHTAYPDFNPFPASSHEQALDKLTMITQQLEEAIGRAVKDPIGADPSDPVLPSYDAGKALMWSESAVELINSTDDFNDIVTLASASASTASVAAVSAAADAVLADASAASALASATLAETAAASIASKNYIMNGDFRIWQRGTAHGNVADYCADRWFMNRAGGVTGITASRQGTPAQYYLGATRVVGDTETGAIDLRQTIEAVNLRGLQGETITVSFEIAKDSGWTGGNIYTVIREADTADIGVFGSYTTITSVITASPTATLTKFSGSVTLQANTKSLQLRISSDAFTGVGVSGDTLYITNIQIEKALDATAFEDRDIATELAMCQRYFERIGGEDGVIASAFATTGSVARATLIYGGIKRVVPTITFSGQNQFRILFSPETFATSSIVGGANITTRTANINVTVTGLTAGEGCQFWPLDTNSFIDIDAEL